jgi:hypothetical protein
VTRLTYRRLCALQEAVIVFEAGGVEEFRGDDSKESQRVFGDLLKAGEWITEQIVKRDSRRR